MQWYQPKRNACGIEFERWGIFQNMFPRSRNECPQSRMGIRSKSNNDHLLNFRQRRKTATTTTTVHTVKHATEEPLPPEQGPLREEQEEIHWTTHQTASHRPRPFRNLNTYCSQSRHRWKNNNISKSVTSQYLADPNPHYVPTDSCAPCQAQRTTFDSRSPYQAADEASKMHVQLPTLTLSSRSPYSLPILSPCIIHIRISPSLFFQM
ncbi:hypothetical protein BX666DRAFT_899044 [Dichotomocladium elegans]|nr:hypothetical protein BX666DRAFT_899044 [Dichotomocladium elegans]